MALSSDLADDEAQMMPLMTTMKMTTGIPRILPLSMMRNVHGHDLIMMPVMMICGADLNDDASISYFQEHACDDDDVAGHDSGDDDENEEAHDADVDAENDLYDDDELMTMMMLMMMVVMMMVMKMMLMMMMMMMLTMMMLTEVMMISTWWRRWQWCFYEGCHLHEEEDETSP